MNEQKYEELVQSLMNEFGVSRYTAECMAEEMSYIYNSDDYGTPYC